MWRSDVSATLNSILLRAPCLAFCVLALGTHHVALTSTAAGESAVASCGKTSCQARAALLQHDRQLVVAPSSLHAQDHLIEQKSFHNDSLRLTGHETATTSSFGQECFVALTYDPTQDQMRRLLRYASEVRPAAKFTLIIDETRPPSHGSVRLRLKALGAEGLDTYGFSEDVALARNPEFRRFWEAWPGKRRYASIAAWFMPLVILDWFNTARPLSCEHFWVITDDVGFSGNIANLVQRYNGDTSDLIQGSFERIVQRQWPMYQFQSKRFWREIWRKNERMRFRLDNTQRLSSRTMRALAKFVNKGAIGTGEVWIPTIAALEGLSVKTFDADVLGNTFAWNGRVSLREWIALRQQNASKLFHALKF